MSDCDLKIRRDSPRAVEGPPYRLNCLSDYKVRPFLAALQYNRREVRRRFV